VGQSELEDLLAHRDRINEKLQTLIDEGTEPWGIKVSMVEVRDVELPETMKRAMAAQAEAERERRAKIVHAEGEFQAAEKLAEAAKIIGRQPAAIQLRYLQTLTQISTEKTNTIVFPLPMDLIMPMLGKLSESKK
jgi:regulator of protease activity HflC (stomatin/prohibitin superfamily)